ncbi:MAG: folate family ECF transporter S component [Clostridiales bacterium]|jgi:ECF transporter S component (folate family)|nr:folate family ECF transporter S component [Clostridiales bacterium]
MDKRKSDFSLAQQEIAPCKPSVTDDVTQPTVFNEQEPTSGNVTPKKRTRRSATLKITYTAVFIALSAALNSLSKNSPVFSLSFTYTIDFFAGLFLGPVYGFFAAFWGDLIGFFVNSGGYPYLPITGISSGFLAFIPGALMNARFLERAYARLKKVNQRILFKSAQIIVCMLLITVVCTAGLNTYSLFVTFSTRPKDLTNFLAYLFARLPAQLPIIAMNTVIIALVYFSFEKQLLKIKHTYDSAKQ